MLRSSMTGYRVSSELLLMKMKRQGVRRRKQNDQNIPNNRHQAQYSSCWPEPEDCLCQCEFISKMKKCLKNWIFACDSNHHQNLNPSVVTRPGAKRATPSQTAYTGIVLCVQGGEREVTIFTPCIFIFCVLHDSWHLSACKSRHMGGGGFSR